MAVQQMANQGRTSSRHGGWPDRFVIALAIEAILILAVVLSSVGVSPACAPDTRWGLGGADPGPGRLWPRLR